MTLEMQLVEQTPAEDHDFLSRCPKDFRGKWLWIPDFPSSNFKLTKQPLAPVFSIFSEACAKEGSFSLDARRVMASATTSSLMETPHKLLKAYENRLTATKSLRKSDFCIERGTFFIIFPAFDL